MADYTRNLNLKKPLQTENYSIDDFNSNFDIIDNKVATKEALTNFISDFFTSGVASLTDPSRDFSISYNNSMSVKITDGVAYSNGNRIGYVTGYPVPSITIDPVTSGTAYIFINAVENHAGEINPDLVPVGFEGIKAFRTTTNTNPLPEGLCVPLYKITITSATTQITAAEVTDLRVQMAFSCGS